MGYRKGRPVMRILEWLYEPAIRPHSLTCPFPRWRTGRDLIPLKNTRLWPGFRWQILEGIWTLDQLLCLLLTHHLFRLEINLQQPRLPAQVMQKNLKYTWNRYNFVFNTFEAYRMIIWLLDFLSRFWELMFYQRRSEFLCCFIAFSFEQ